MPDKGEMCSREAGDIGPWICNKSSILRCGRKRYNGTRLSCDDIQSPNRVIVSDKGGGCWLRLGLSADIWKARNYMLRWGTGKMGVAY